MNNDLELEQLSDMLGVDTRFKLLHHLQFESDGKLVDIARREQPTPFGEIVETLDIRIQEVGNLNVFSDMTIRLGMKNG